MRFPRACPLPLILLAALPASMRSQPADLVSRIWDGVQEAQKKYQSGCGRITETRVSKLLAKPMVFHGKFCAEGLSRFALEYSDPDPIRIRFNEDFLNVTTGGGKNTEVIDVGSNVRRTQSYFSKGNSLANLKQNFVVSAREDGRDYEMKLVPRSARFGKRVNHIVVRVAMDDFLLRSLEVDGVSGVNSVFQIEITSLNTKIPPGTFTVYRPK